VPPLVWHWSLEALVAYVRAATDRIAGERVVARMLRRDPICDISQIVSPSKTAERDLDHGAPVVTGRAVTASHLTTLRLGPSRPPVLTIASKNVWKERHTCGALSRQESVM
jgi:hypothetical protein